MGIESIVLELMERIQILEAKVARLESEAKVRMSSENVSEDPICSDEVSDNETREISLTQSARDYINNAKIEARNQGQTSIKLLCNDIQKALGVKNRPAGICNAMYECMTNPKDKVLSAPPSGKSTTVLIEYYVK